MILVFTNTITQRIAYAMNLVFKDVLGVNFVLTESINEYQQSSLPKFIYSAEVHSNELFLKQDGLMLENTVTKKTFDVKTEMLNGFKNGVAEAGLVINYSTVEILGLFLITVFISVGGSFFAIKKINSVEPASVFRG